MSEQPSPREYIRALRGACNDAIRQGRQIDFWDAFAISRPTGEQAIYWFLPKLREVQQEHAHLTVALAELTALVDEYFAIDRDAALLDELEPRLRRALDNAKRVLP